ncbi:MAG: dephospho-CoA kinase [Erysipelotrichaceae bacterium]|nr:dephospho-CoA kinase [Erysipelotrichaceae bacterium]
MIIGITGGIATGKSTVSHYLKQLGYQVIDADQISFEALTKDTKCIQNVLTKFECQDQNGNIDRKKLGEIIFNDKIKQQQLEDIVHPYVIKNIKKQIKNSMQTIVFLDIPLLYEAKLEYLCDYVVVVYINEQLQKQRLKERNHLTNQEVEARIQSQMPIETKKQLAHYIINNEGDLNNLYDQIEVFLKKINKGEIEWNNC